MPSAKESNFPTVLILFGITGDLAATKIIPAIFHLHTKNLLPENFSIVGFSRRDLSKEDLSSLILTALAKHPDVNPDNKQLESFVALFSYQQGYFDKDAGYETLANKLGFIDNKWQTCSSKLFYLAVPPSYYDVIFDKLHKSRLAEPCSPEERWTRIVVEKPFGKDLKTAQELDTKLSRLFREEQIYRIDHYLGKEMVQNLLIFRFANNLLENTWNNKAVESIHVKFHEKLGVEGRTQFYDGVGALRDVGQNHLLQMLALVTMEDPGEFTASSIREERTKVLSSLRELSEQDIKINTVRGQYKGYKEHKGVKVNSDTETYFKIYTFVDNPTWENVPIVLEGGKKLSETDKEIVINFKHRSPCLCPPGQGHHKNRVVFDLDGADEGITIEFWAKKPGLGMELEKREFFFKLCPESEECTNSEAYEKLLLDCIEGNQTLFVSTDEIKAMWDFIDPIISEWKKGTNELKFYKQGENASDIN